jgi:hypothetical protein
MVVLQDCMDLEKCVPGPYSETYPTSSHVANQPMNIKVDEVSDIEVEEKHPVPTSFIGMKDEHEVSCMSVLTVWQISHTTGISCCPSCLHLSVDTALVNGL